MEQRFQLLLLLLLIPVQQSGGYLFDVQDVIYEFLVTNCSHNERVLTFDIEGDNKTRGATEKVAELARHPPVEFDTGPVTYGTARVQSLELSAVYVQTFHNNQSDVEGKAHISEKIEQEDEFMWTVTSGAELSVTAKFQIEVPLVYSFSSEFSTTLKKSSGSTTIETITTRQWIKQDVRIPPGATIQAKWYVNKAQVEVPWVANITMKGYVAALFESTTGLGWKYFNVNDIKHEQLIHEGDSVIFQAKGLFKANVAQSYHLSTTERELTPHTASLAKYIFEE
ncbi:cytotoxin-like [Ixodes scapularis]|uniref:cytotoxin-like n=1 Tax=Ixodes scapularis TaxID=6945 RepID=UPI001A9D324C|nr:cytotoxin-like [Ixodes scapularis]